MKEKQLKSRKASSSRFYPMYVVMFLLLFGIVFSFLQIDKNQNLESRAQTITNCDVDTLPPTTEEQALFNSINTYRQEQSIPALMYSEVLSRPAQWNADDITKRGNSQGNDSLGRDLQRRLTNCGVMLTAMGEFGESVLMAPTEAEAVMVLRRNSTATGNTRDDNVIYRPFTHVGIGKNGTNWVIVFAHGLNASTVTIIPTPTFGSISVPTVEPTNEPAVMTPDPSGEDPTPTPCVENQLQTNNDDTVNANHNKRKKKKSNGDFDGLLQILLKLLEQLIALLGGGTVPTQPPSQEPTNPGTDPAPDPGTDPDPTDTPNNPCP
jgi:hypothetical protein